MDEEIAPRVKLLRMLVSRLERLSVDSIWARRANGLRGSLVKALEAADENRPPSASHLDQLINHSFEMLSRSAREIPDAEHHLWSRIKEKDQHGA